MAQRPMSGSRNAPLSWWLASPHDKNTQGLVVSGFADQPVARALFLKFDWCHDENKGGGAWLTALCGVAPITDADGKDSRSTAIGFTSLGLRKMGFNANSLESFDRPFKEGMFQEDRLRRLGDKRDDQWMPTVIEGGPKWSGNIPLEATALDVQARAFRAPEDKKQEASIRTPITVHALLLLYTEDELSADSWLATVQEAIAPLGVTVVHQLPLSLSLDEKKIGREHFGFADGISQPVPFEKGVVKIGTGEDASEKDTVHRVPLGEILMGHLNGHSEIAAGPVVPDTPEGRAAGLKPHPRGEGFLDFGLDGSYMVVRELKQDVAQFWQSMDQSATQLNASAPPGATKVDADWVANRVVGRDRDGNLLCPGGVLPSDASGQPDNEFRYFDRDKLGRGCPLGSHVRRGNPRDGLAPTTEHKDTLLDAANNHRILRRGRNYGPNIADQRVDDSVDRGLLFLCLNTDIGRQFEFVQQTWILNPNFACLYDETDPLIGPTKSFTIQEALLRQIIPVKSYVQMAGGEYFFLPSMAALRYLEAL